jgi:glucose-1-phosphate thymidylyltransferase
MKGVILAGGSGTRLSPLTLPVCKQLLPVYNKPMIHYPLTTLILAGIREILIITTPHDKPLFERTLGDGKHWGISIEFAIQDQPRGIAEGIVIAEKFIGTDEFAYILGDNIFYGAGLGRTLSKFRNIEGAQIFAFQVADPERYGVVELDEELIEIISIEEKPSKPKSSFAIAGMYFYNNSAIKIAKELNFSDRGELEITDLNEIFWKSNSLKVEILHRGTTWLDAGTFSSLHDAASFVKIMEERQAISIGDPLEAAKIQGWV